VTTEPRNPRERYQNAERALAALNVDDPNTLAVTALVSAILATLPPRRAPRRAANGGRHLHGGTPQARWLLGDDEEGKR
jgi:hypothetical protein